jgi:rSAM/selenodomain-associated transferase 1
MNNKALIIFTRNPELGKVKTRLAKTIGDEKTLEIYKELLLHTRNETQHIDCDKFLFYDTTIVENDIWSTEYFNKVLQAPGDLGNKMQAAFDSLFQKGYNHCVVVGSDLFDLKASIIENAFTALQNNDAVVGPAEDGGYYLLGLNQSTPAVFNNKEWGTATVFNATMNDLKNVRVQLLETLNDIDTFEDLERSGYNINFKEQLL